MSSIIDINIYNNNELTYEKKEISCEYKKKNYIEYNDDYGMHHINLIDNIYKKKSNTEQIIIDFNNNSCQIITSDGYDFSIDIESNLIINEDSIVLEYVFGDEQIKIKLDMKE